MSLTELFTSIADTIRNRNPHHNEKIKALDFPDEIGRACDEVHYMGYSLGESEGMAKGKQEQYDFFWDKFQNYGKKEQYTYSFYGWYDGAYNPKYPIVCQKNWSTVDIFRGSHISDTLVDIELQSNTSAGYMFLDCYEMITIRKIKMDETVSIQANAFRNCSKLENINIEGAIGATLDFHWSPLLTVESLRSILTALSKDSTYANGKTLTLNTASKAVVEADSECSTQLASAVSAGWTIAYA